MRFFVLGLISITLYIFADYFTKYVSFPSTELLSVAPAMFYDVEYAYPQVLERETRKSHLFDGSGNRAHALVSPDFRLHEFMAPMRR